jgi:hypothetical protein
MGPKFARFYGDDPLPRRPQHHGTPRGTSRGVEAVEGGEEPSLPGTPMRFSQAVGVLDTRPGVDRRGAAILVAE